MNNGYNGLPTPSFGMNPQPGNQGPLAQTMTRMVSGNSLPQMMPANYGLAQGAGAQNQQYNAGLNSANNDFTRFMQPQPGAQQPNPMANLPVFSRLFAGTQGMPQPMQPNASLQQPGGLGSPMQPASPGQAQDVYMQHPRPSWGNF